ncbi:hypothetical protein Cni_G18053 [Canna indica]|uniref:RecA family profile 1 domain-containing protein n=1 Tax=Canna indica TaxID=4628 RepID=A0AAQ3QIC2_9LILI|nr:hypothetical protein Cni_G18053 [Canna indica]
MLTLPLHRSKVFKMQCFHNLLHRQKLAVLSRSGVFGGSRILSSSIDHGLKLLHRPRYFPGSFFHSGVEGWEEEIRGLSARNDVMESNASSTSYGKFRDGGKPLGWEPMGTPSKGRNSGVDSSSEEDMDKISTYLDLDPLHGKMTTNPAAEEGDYDPREQIEENPRVEKSVQKKTSGRPKRLAVRSTAGVEKNEATLRYSAVRRKPEKVKNSWVCENCGNVYGQWWGSCRSCHTAGSIKKFSESEVSRARGAEISDAMVRSWLPEQSRTLAPLSLVDVNMGRDQSQWRIPLSGHFGVEVSKVLGGGIVPGSLILIGGDPGVGKSTLALQIAAILAEGFNFNGPVPVVYVSGEESIEQIGNRAHRMRITTKDLFLYSSTDIEDILDKIQKLSPQALILDSIQTVYLRGVAGSAGNIMQVKECTSALLRFAKQTNIPVLLIGHVTKTGDIAGPRILEHIVDAVIYMEGERCSAYRLLRAVKNRFGSTDELGVFEMSESGLQAVSNPSQIFLSENFSDSEVLAGLAVAVIVDGSRTFLIEVQALCVSDSFVGRQFNGIPQKKAALIISVLMKQAGLKLQDNAIFLNVVSGFELTETAGDLAIAAAICSSFLEYPIPNDYAFIGEVGLGGELRSVPRMDKRVIAVAKLGFKKCIIPKSAEKSLSLHDLDLEILGCRNLKEVINAVFQG